MKRDTASDRKKLNSRLMQLSTRQSRNASSCSKCGFGRP